MLGHPFGPLGAPADDSSPYRIKREERVGVLPAGVDPTLRFPVHHGQHNWVVVMTSPTPAEVLLAGGFEFRAHALADVSAHCWTCERDFTPDIALGPCLGDPQGVEIPTRAEFRAWTDEQKLAWIKRLNRSRE